MRLAPPIFVAIMLSFAYIQSASQDQIQSKLRLETKRTESGFDIKCLNDANVMGRFSLYITFRNSQNVNHPINLTTVISPGSHVLTMNFGDPKAAYYFGGYSYEYVRGVYNIDIDEQIIYRIPLSASKKTRVLHLKDVSTYLGVAVKDTLKGFMFTAQVGDTVYASRRGTVVELVDDMDLTFTSGLDQKGNNHGNYIIVEHKDGSLARYSLLGYKSIWVKKGQEVFPDTPIALVGTRDGTTYQVHLIINSLRKEQTVDPKEFTFRQKFVMPQFATTNGVVTLSKYSDHVVIDDISVVQQEMNKREIKKRWK